MHTAFRRMQSEPPLTAAPLEWSPEILAYITDGRKKKINPPMKLLTIKSAHLLGLAAQALSTGEAEAG